MAAAAAAAAARRTVIANSNYTSDSVNEQS